jgi:aminoglycoside phosphotransferase family enzyme
MNPAAPTPETITSNLISQEELVSFCMDSASYSHRPSGVRLIQTHCSFVFLATPFVFKVKKPVNFGFLDFSTLEKRRFYCQREVELNRRLCPDMYLGVVAICRQGDHLTFDPRGMPVEFAVKMHELAEPYFIKELLQQGQVGLEHRTNCVRAEALL